MDKVVLIDGHSILNRAFYGLPDLTNSAGVHTGAVYGFLTILFRILDEEKPQYLAVAFDVHAPTFRHASYADYKGTRHPMPDELREQVPLIKQVLTAMDIPIYEKEGLEADDILGSLAKKVQAAGKEALIATGDRDLLQVADDHIKIRLIKTVKGQQVVEIYGPAEVKEKLLVTPKEYIEVKALQGDSSDNVPGVPKVGPKTATELILQYHSVDGVYEHLDEIKKKGLHDTLLANEDKARLSLFLVTIKTDADVELDERARLTDYHTKEAYRLFTELGFKNLLSGFDPAVMKEEDMQEKGENAPSLCIIESLAEAAETIDQMGQHCCKRKEDPACVIGVYPVFDVPALGMADTLLGLALCTDNRACYFVVKEDPGDPDAISTAFLTGCISALFQIGCRLSVFDFKAQIPFFGIRKNAFADGIRLEGILDCLLCAYLINPLKSDYEPEDVASLYLGETIEGKKQFLAKKSFALKQREEGTALVASFAVRTAGALQKAAPVLEAKLKELSMWELYEKVELPLTYVLYDMQRIGIRVLPDKLKAYGEQLTGRIGELETSIHEAAGHDFNIASPKQLGVVLFEEMGLPGAKKTKSGYSTAADVLEKLSPDYPIVADVLEYRALTKLKSTYADGLYAFIAGDKRIHTTFNQTITATGRISSTDPNLQNIPMRTELGRAIRKVFVPCEGWCFYDADYSQIELRILASMSGDEALIQAYRENRDIHATTAAKVFHVPYDAVTQQMRRNAKAVNFGIVYGISSFGLSQNLSISRKEASQYIEEYFRMFPGVKAFLDKEVEDAKIAGYSVTMFGRRRPIPELKSSNYMQRQFGERVAMNAPIQGTGADIMKIAMVRVWEAIEKKGLSSRLILQIHDELLIETAPGEEEAVAEILQACMMGAAALKVPLVIDTHSGSDWYEAK